MTPRIENTVKVSETSTNAYIRWDSQDKRKDQIQWHKNSWKWGVGTLGESGETNWEYWRRKWIEEKKEKIIYH